MYCFMSAYLILPFLLTKNLVYWALPPIGDTDCHIKGILETYFKLFSFTLEWIFLQQFLLGVFTLWALLTSFILGLKWQWWWWLFLPLSSSPLAATISAMMMVVMVVVCGNSRGGKQVVMEMWICRWRNLLCFSLSLVLFSRFYFLFVEIQNSSIHAWVSSISSVWPMAKVAHMPC